jgi:hypothetical protein
LLISLVILDTSDNNSSCSKSSIVVEFGSKASNRSYLDFSQVPLRDRIEASEVWRKVALPHSPI